MKEPSPRIIVLLVSIGNMKIGNSLIDLGANMNIIPLSVVERIGYLQIEPFASTL